MLILTEVSLLYTIFTLTGAVINVSKVSICMSSYNHANFLREAIDSVLNQTFEDFELFIYDDASTDASWQVIQSYTDARITSFRSVANQHDKAWMKKVIYKMASGDLIAVHHSDNLWEPEKLQKQVSYLEAHPDTGAVFTNIQNINEAGEPLDDNPNKDINRNRHEWLNYFFYRGNGLCHPSILIRKKCFDACGFYRNGLAQLPDFDLWVRLCMHYEIHVIPEKLVRYRVRADRSNIGGNRPDARIRMQFEFLQLLENYTKIPTYEEFVKIFPAAEKYYRPDGYDIGYILGMTALELQESSARTRMFGIPTYHLFGLKLLFEALNDPARADKIKELYGFGHKELIALTGSHDVFSFEEKKYLRSKLREKEEGVWKIASFFSRIGEALVPRNSRRYRFFRKLYKTIRFPHKDIYN